MHVCVRVCTRVLSGSPFSTDPINPPIFRAFRSLVTSDLWLAPCVCCGMASPQKKTLATVEFHSSPFSTHSYARLSSAPVGCLCLLFLVGPGLIPLADHSQIPSICHVITFSLCLFYFSRFSCGRSFKVIDCFWLFFFFFSFLHFTLFFASHPPFLTYLLHLKVILKQNCWLCSWI